MRDQTEVCPLSRGAMCSHPYPPYYRVAFASSVIPYPLPHRLACGLLSLAGGQWAYHVPRMHPDGLGPACSPVVVSSTLGDYEAPSPDHIPFWFKPISTFGLSRLHDVYRRFTFSLAIPSTLAPDRLDASSRNLTLTMGLPPHG